VGRGAWRGLLIAPGSNDNPLIVAGGQRVISEFLASRGISIPDLVLENGSGLSRNERITAAGLADVLLDASRSPYSPEFQASLPLAAVDGTLRRRFRSPDMEGRLRMKTGTLEDVSALAGYVNAASGKTYVAVIILNHPGAPNGAGEAIQAALVDWVFGR
jgi:D-alanyl-D-alanine carboxypeptidase/D-alanyl-D-alanine-endopeptidase (penicillin-binding protein 4)